MADNFLKSEFLFLSLFFPFPSPTQRKSEPCDSFRNSGKIVGSMEPKQSLKNEVELSLKLTKEDLQTRKKEVSGCP